MTNRFHEGRFKKQKGEPPKPRRLSFGVCPDEGRAWFGEDIVLEGGEKTKPRYCAVCERKLEPGEKELCPECVEKA